MVESREEFLLSQAELLDKPSGKLGMVKVVALFVSSTLAILSLPVALFGLQPAEFVFVVSGWVQSVASSSSALCPCLYVVLNIIILTLGVKSGALSTSTSTSISHCHCSCSQGHYKTDMNISSEALLSSENIILRPQWKVEDMKAPLEYSYDGSYDGSENNILRPQWEAEDMKPVECINDGSENMISKAQRSVEDMKSAVECSYDGSESKILRPQWKAEDMKALVDCNDDGCENKILRPQWKAEECINDGSLKAAKTHKASALVLQRTSSFRELHCKKVTKLSNLSKESTHVQPYHKYSDEESVEVIFEICVGEGGDNENEGCLTCEELNAKAESFIGNFYRELKMQREDSWNRLCAIYNQSC